MKSKKHYDSANPNDVKEELEEEEIQRRQELNDIRTILGLPAGIRFFKGMFEVGHIEGDIFTGNAQTYYNLGLREFAIKYWKAVKEADSEAFTRILLSIAKDS